MKKRFKILQLAIVCVLTVSIIFPLVSYAYFPGLDAKADGIKAELEKEIQYKNSIEGTITDSNGEIISYATKPGSPATCDFEAYNSLIGYNTYSFGSSGLRNRYFNELKTQTGKDNKGATLQLTTINELQCLAYELIKGQDASVVVLGNTTGRILALASSNSAYELDINNINATTLAEANKHEGALLPSWKATLAPGSIFKVVTSIPIIEHGWHNEIYDADSQIAVGGATFKNYGNKSYANTDLKSAFGNSVNTYFIQYGKKLGSYSLRDICERFLIGTDIELDFTTLTSSHGLDDPSASNVAATSFGQGKVLLSPIHMAMIASSIANGGTMLKPYLIDSVVTSDTKVTYKGKPEKLTQVADKEITDILMKTLQESAVEYYDIPASYNIAAKTGTAELGHSIPSGTGQNRATFMSCTDKYTVIICSNYTKKFGGDFKQSALQLYDLLDSLEKRNLIGG